MAVTGAAAIPLYASGMAKFGGPQVLVPANKGLSKTWIDSLTKRGIPTIYKGDALKHIGMQA